jgi:catechol 2,3-dioxygenase-like lactoylglutathione lyase family enzyme
VGTCESWSRLVLVAIIVIVVSSPASLGVHELIIGVDDRRAADLRDYYSQMGFSRAAEAALDGELAKALYGSASSAHVERLRHGGSLDGGLRLMIWEHGAGEGMGMATLGTEGARWATLHTTDLLNLLNHARDAERRGAEIAFVGPVRNFVLPDHRRGGRPFLDRAPCIHELALITPVTREVFFQRHDYESELGEVDDAAHFRCSRLLHFAVVSRRERGCGEFYRDALGWQIVSRRDESESAANRELYGLHLELGERMIVTILQPPDGEAAAATQLHLIELEVTQLVDCRLRARPGNLGPSGYVLRVEGIERARARVMAAGAIKVSDLVVNEFGEPSFSFVAPDGYWWSALERI